MTRAEFFFLVILWKLLLLVMAAVPVYAMLTQPRPPDIFEMVLISTMSFGFVLAAIFTRLGD